jgi:hypothetical protein
LRPMPCFRPKLCSVAIYQDGCLKKVVWSCITLERAAAFCGDFNKLNRDCDSVAAYQPISASTYVPVGAEPERTACRN